ncbi:hypothetical protein Vi05172_g3139 [Venturia inaequalis]|nr:hypothetical protein Vi05172_g3139 [Venturia inaequalis]
MRFQILFLLSLATSIMAAGCIHDKDCSPAKGGQAGTRCLTCAAAGVKAQCVAASKCTTTPSCSCKD